MGERREKERERNINVWLPLAHPLLGTWLTTQACAVTGSQTSNPLSHRPALDPLSHTSQASIWVFDEYKIFLNLSVETLSPLIYFVKFHFISSLIPNTSWFFFPQMYCWVFVCSPLFMFPCQPSVDIVYFYCYLPLLTIKKGMECADRWGG